nr:hypothetical protein Itr_chr14CG15440 [Ipomoea trifida]
MIFRKNGGLPSNFGQLLALEGIPHFVSVPSRVYIIMKIIYPRLSHHCFKPRGSLPEEDECCCPSEARSPEKAVVVSITVHAARRRVRGRKENERDCM